MAFIKFYFLLGLAVLSLAQSVVDPMTDNVAESVQLSESAEQPNPPSVIAGHSHLFTRRHQHHARFHSSHIQKRGTGTYTVVSGDSGNSIAAKFSTTYNALSSANSNVNLNSLKAGQTLQMPSLRKPQSYNVRSGDTGNAIAYAYDIYFADLSTANPSVNWNALQIGQTLSVPTYGVYSAYTIVSGDTGWAISQAYGISFSTLSNANPGVNWNDLQIGSVITIPAGTSPSQGTLPYPAKSPTGKSSSPTTTSNSVKSSTTTSNKTSTTSVKTTVTTSTTPAAFRSTTASGKTSTTPSSSSPTKTSTVASTTSSVKTSTTSATTFSTVVKTTTSSVKTSSTTQTAAGSYNPSFTQTAKVTGANFVSPVNNNENSNTGSDSYTFYQGDGSTSAGWPAMSSWASFANMWAANAPYLGQTCVGGAAPNTASENTGLYNAIQQIATYSGLDHRFILAVIIQESSGCVRVPTTVSADGTLYNPGLMQDYMGSWTCNYNKGNGTILNPCYEQNIVNMIAEGAMGTQSGPGLVQDMNSCGGYTGSQAFYRTARIYNSGSVPSSNDLGAPGATRCYASDIANRLMGWVTAGSKCTLH